MSVWTNSIPLWFYLVNNTLFLFWMILMSLGMYGLYKRQRRTEKSVDKLVYKEDI